MLCSRQLIHADWKTGKQKGEMPIVKELKDVFPMLWRREDILKYVDAHEHLKRIFNEWRPEEQKEFLNICTGVRGVKMLYDGFLFGGFTASPIQAA